MVGAAETRALIAAGGFTAPSTQRTAVFARASRCGILFPPAPILHFAGTKNNLERDRAARC